MSRKNQLIIVLTILFTFIYAFERYVVFGTTSIQQVPLYLLNKVVSFSGIVIISITLIISNVLKRRKMYDNSASKQNTLLGLFGVSLIVFHFLISIIIFSKEYFPKLYLNDKLSMSGEVSLLFSNIALILLSFAGIISFIKVFTKVEIKIKSTYLQFIKIALVFTCFHLIFMGWSSWFVFSKWNGGLPPMTLLAFIVIISVFVYRFIFAAKKSIE